MQEHLEQTKNEIIERIENNIEIADDKGIVYNPETLEPIKSMVVRWNPNHIQELDDVVGTLSASKEIVSIICRKLTQHILNPVKPNESIS